MKCPHCLVEYHAKVTEGRIGADVDGHYWLETDICPACKRMIVCFVEGEAESTQYGWVKSGETARRLVRPAGISRAPLPAAVPKEFTEDYLEASLVLADSPKASAALSRRCLQHLLREKVGVTPGNLASEIQQVLESGNLPSDLAESVDGIRNIGNFAAHPMKSESSGEVVPVEPGEAEWNLDVLEELFDFYFVRPAAIKARRDALNAKLSDAGKPPMR